jgi:hypothetical protein
MFDDLRGMSDGSAVFEEPPEAGFDSYSTSQAPRGRLFGMTPIQRFILSLLLLGAVLMMGMMCLLVTQKLWLA